VSEQITPSYEPWEEDEDEPRIPLWGWPIVLLAWCVVKLFGLWLSRQSRSETDERREG